MRIFEHPYWPLLFFGFLFAPRMLLLSLWIPIRSNLEAFISFPNLSYAGWLLMPRLTLACIYTGYYWNTDKILCVIAFILSFTGEGVEKKFVWKFKKGTKKKNQVN